jgi:hypothetical protein
MAGRWRKTARDRYAWKLILKETKVLCGPYSQWRERARERERARQRDIQRERLLIKEAQLHTLGKHTVAYIVPKLAVLNYDLKCPWRIN